MGGRNFVVALEDDVSRAAGHGSDGRGWRWTILPDWTAPKRQNIAAVAGHRARSLRAPARPQRRNCIRSDRWQDSRVHVPRAPGRSCRRHHVSRWFGRTDRLRLQWSRRTPAKLFAARPHRPRQQPPPHVQSRGFASGPILGQFADAWNGRMRRGPEETWRGRISASAINATLYNPGSGRLNLGFAVQMR